MHTLSKRALGRLLTLAVPSLMTVFSACEQRAVPQAAEPPCFAVEFRLGDAPEVRTGTDASEPRTSGAQDRGTRATGVQPSEETQVNGWTLCVYRLSDGQLAAAGSAASSASVTRPLSAGAYRAVAVVNPPASFDASAFLTESALEGQTAFLADNARGALEMYGALSFTLGEGPASVAIQASRLVSKVLLRKVTLRLTDAGLAALPFTLDAVYLDNVPARTAWGEDPDYSGLDSDRARWYNAMGWHAPGSCTSPACPDALLGDRNIGAQIVQGCSHRTEYTYYSLPNPTPASADTREATWAKRATRLVIEARIGSQTQYYVASLPEMARNHSYVIEEAVITGLGAADPETETPNSLALLFSVADDGWEDGGTIIL